jgi:hypothetical protein
MLQTFSGPQSVSETGVLKEFGQVLLKFLRDITITEFIYYLGSQQVMKNIFTEANPHEESMEELR